MDDVDLPPVQAARRRVPIELLSLLISATLVVAGIALDGSLLTMRRTAVQLAIGALNIVLVLTTLYCLLRAARLTADAWRIVPLVPFLQFINSLPFLYMGWGGREIAIAMTLGTVAGLSLNEALAVSAAWGIILLLTSLINGAFLVGDWRGYRRA